MKKYCAKCLSLLLLWLLSCSSSTHEEIKVRLAQDPSSLHPINHGNAYALQILNLIYQSLVIVDLKDQTIKPLLASDLPQVRREDSISYFTFSIRPEARWDDGTPVTAADVAFSLKLIHSPLLDNERWRAQYDFILDIQFSATNPKTVTLVCKGYTSEMELITGDFLILPAHRLDPKKTLAAIPYKLIRQKFDSLSNTNTFKTYAAFITNKVFARDTAFVRGSGPYKLKMWKPGKFVLLEKKKSWWGRTAKNEPRTLIANPERIGFHIIPDNAAAVLALKTQQLDFMDNVPLISFLEMRKDIKYRKLYNFYTPSTYDLVFMGLNGNNPLLHDRLTRQALAHLIDIPLIIKSFHNGLATPTVGIVHPSEKQYYHSGLQPLSFDTLKARQLLQKAGWRSTSSGWLKKINGKDALLKLNFLHRAGNSDFENIAFLFQQNAQSLGIPVTLQTFESSQISEKLQNRDYDIFLRTLVGNPFSYNMIPMLHTSNASEGGANITNFGTPETDLLLERIATEEKESVKAKLLKDLQLKMREEGNYVFLYFSQSKMIISKQIDSVVVSNLKPGYDLARFSKKGAL